VVAVHQKHASKLASISFVPAGDGVVVRVVAESVFGSSAGRVVPEGAVVSGVGRGVRRVVGWVLAFWVRVRDALLVAEQLPLQTVVFGLQSVDFTPETQNLYHKNLHLSKFLIWSMKIIVCKKKYLD
jgi:hypothetical protein